MGLPLYRSVRQSPPVHDAQNPSGNCGLWFERFYDRYPDDFSKTKSDDNDFKQWLTDFNHLAGDSNALDMAIERQSRLVESLGGTSALYQGDWHFVSGMGNPHPLENGVTWHPVWGVPYLAGSGLKGVVRSWIEAWEFDEESHQTQTEKKKKLLDWFGSDDKDTQNQSILEKGKLIFFDAIPYKPVRLVSDIMTPHMGEWYAGGEDLQSVDQQPSVVPADWHSPTPIYFLAAKEPLFLISVAPRDELVADVIDLEEVMGCITNALEWLGAGAKTAVGYGQFYRDDTATQRHQRMIKDTIEAQVVAAEQSAQLSGLAGIALEMVERSQQEGWSDNKEAFTKTGEIEGWLDRLEAEPDMEALAFLRDLFDQHFIGLLANPEKTKGKKKQAVFKPRQQALARRVLALAANDGEA